MRVLIVGAGGVGSALATICARRDAFEQIVVADVDPARRRRAAATAHERACRSAHASTPSQRLDVVELAATTRGRRHRQRLRPAVQPADLRSRVRGRLPLPRHGHAPVGPAPDRSRTTRSASASARHSSRPATRGRSAACSHSSGWASSPASPTSPPATRPTTCSRRSTRSACATAATSSSRASRFAPTFSIWTTIEECLNPPIVYERDRGWFTTAPFSEPELFTFPEGIGAAELRQRRARRSAADAPMDRRRPGDVQVRARRRVPRCAARRCTSSASTRPRR